MLSRLRIVVIICSTVLCVFGCKPKAVVVKNNVSAMKAIIRTDSMFSAMSKNAGMRKAFIEFIADEGVLLRQNHLPIVGADAIEFLSQAADSSVSTLTWEPLGGDVSISGDLGFTYGTYELLVTDTSFTGTYVSVWKKQPDGKWKFVLDSGNEGTQAIQ